MDLDQSAEEGGDADTVGGDHGLGFGRLNDEIGSEKSLLGRDNEDIENLNLGPSDIRQTSPIASSSIRNCGGGQPPAIFPDDMELQFLRTRLKNLAGSSDTRSAAAQRDEAVEIARCDRSS